jgi:spermidine synthase
LTGCALPGDHASVNGTGARARTSLILAAFLLSGACGLVYETIWARALAVIVGGTALATQAVLATFFAGLTAGAFVLGRRVASASRGARAYAFLELGVALAGLFSLGALALAAPFFAARSDGAESAATAALAFAVTIAVCFPATFMMGATYPAATRALSQWAVALRSNGGRLLGLAYAANTAGAVLGAAVTAFWLLPTLGVRGALLTAIAGNVVAATLALIAERTIARGFAPGLALASEKRPGAFARPAHGLAAAALISGLASVSLQIVAIRILAVTLHDTVYTFALAVGSYIFGASAGAALFDRASARLNLVPARAFAVAAMLCGLWLSTLKLGAPVVSLLSGDADFLAVVGAEVAVTLLLAAPVAIPTTWVFLSLARQVAPEDPAAGAGWATAWNGVGCALAPVLSALLLLPAAGTLAVAAFALAMLVLGSALSQGRVATTPVRARLETPLAALGGAAIGLLLVRGGLFTWVADDGYTLIWKKEGASLAVAVEQSPEGRRRLRTNNTFTEGGDAARIIQLRQGMLGGLLRRHGSRALVMGVGSGGTLAGVHSGLPDARIDAVELASEIAEGLPFFSSLTGHIEKNPKVTMHVGDARAFAAHAAAQSADQTADQTADKDPTYDLVVGELFHMQTAGAGSLYTHEHFSNVKRALAREGLYLQWVPLHETPTPEVRTIVRTFYDVFPHGVALLGGWSLRTPILGLVGTRAPLALDWQAVAAWNLAHPLRHQHAQVAELTNLAELFATFVTDAAGMRRWAGPGDFNTDDDPQVEFRAPRGHVNGIASVLSLFEVRGSPGSWLRDDDGQRQQVIALQSATGHYYRGHLAWRQEDLDTAEKELKKALAAAPGFAPARQALTDLDSAKRALRSRGP